MEAIFVEGVSTTNARRQVRPVSVRNAKPTRLCIPESAFRKVSYFQDIHFRRLVNGSEHCNRTDVDNSQQYEVPARADHEEGPEAVTRNDKQPSCAGVCTHM